MAAASDAYLDPLAARTSTLQCAYHDPRGVWRALEGDFYARMPLAPFEWRPPDSGVTYILQQLSCAMYRADDALFAFPPLPINWYRSPYVHFFFVKCESHDEFYGVSSTRNREGVCVRDAVKAWVNDMISRGQEWLVVYLPIGERTVRKGSMEDRLRSTFSGITGSQYFAGTSLSSTTYRKIYDDLRGECAPRKHGDRFVRLDHFEMFRREQQRRHAGRARAPAGPSTTSSAAHRILARLRLVGATIDARGGGGGAARGSASSSSIDDDWAAWNIPNEPLHPLDPAAAEEIMRQWGNLMDRVHSAVFDSLSARVRNYYDEVHKMYDKRYVPGWNFCQYFCMKESLAFVFSQVRVAVEALRCYETLEQTFLLLAAVPPRTTPLVRGDNTSAAALQHGENGKAVAAARSGQRTAIDNIFKGSGNLFAVQESQRTIAGISELPMLAAYPADVLQTLAYEAEHTHGVRSGESAVPSRAASHASLSIPRPLPAPALGPPPWLTSFPLSFAHPPPHVLDVTHKPFRQLIYSSAISLFDLRHYLLVRQLSLLNRMRRPVEMAERALRLLSFAHDAARAYVATGQLHPNAARAWLFCACMDLVEVCTRKRGGGGHHHHGHSRSTPERVDAPVVVSSSTAAPQVAHVGAELRVNGHPRRGSRSRLDSVQESEMDETDEDAGSHAGSEASRANVQAIGSEDTSARPATAAAESSNAPPSAATVNATESSTAMQTTPVKSRDGSRAPSPTKLATSDVTTELSAAVFLRSAHVRRMSRAVMSSSRMSVAPRSAISNAAVGLDASDINEIVYEDGDAEEDGDAVTADVTDLEAEQASDDDNDDEDDVLAVEMPDSHQMAASRTSMTSMSAEAAVVQEPTAASDAASATAPVPPAVATSSDSATTAPLDSAQLPSELHAVPSSTSIAPPALVPEETATRATAPPRDSHTHEHAHMSTSQLSTVDSMRLSGMVCTMLATARRQLVQLLRDCLKHDVLALPDVASLMVVRTDDAEVARPPMTRRARSSSVSLLLSPIKREATAAATASGDATATSGSGAYLSNFELNITSTMSASDAQQHAAAVAASGPRAAHSAAGLSLVNALASKAEADRLFAAMSCYASYHQKKAGLANVALITDVQRAMVLIRHREFDFALALLQSQIGAFAERRWHTLYEWCLMLCAACHAAVGRHTDFIKTTLELLDPRLRAAALGWGERAQQNLFSMPSDGLHNHPAGLARSRTHSASDVMHSIMLQQAAFSAGGAPHALYALPPEVAHMYPDAHALLQLLADVALAHNALSTDVHRPLVDELDALVDALGVPVGDRTLVAGDIASESDDSSARDRSSTNASRDGVTSAVSTSHDVDPVSTPATLTLRSSSAAQFRLLWSTHWRAGLHSRTSRLCHVMQSLQYAVVASHYIRCVTEAAAVLGRRLLRARRDAAAQEEAHARAPTSAPAVIKLTPEQRAAMFVRSLMRPHFTSCVTFTGAPPPAFNDGRTHTKQRHHRDYDTGAHVSLPVAELTHEHLRTLLTPRPVVRGQKMTVAVHVTNTLPMPWHVDAVELTLRHVEARTDASGAAMPGTPSAAAAAPARATVTSGRHIVSSTISDLHLLRHRRPFTCHGVDTATLAVDPNVWVPLGCDRALPPPAARCARGVQQDTFIHSAAWSRTHGGRPACAASIAAETSTASPEQRTMEAAAVGRGAASLGYDAGVEYSFEEWATGAPSPAARTSSARTRADAAIVLSSKTHLSSLHRPERVAAAVGSAASPPNGFISPVFHRDASVSTAGSAGSTSAHEDGHDIAAHVSLQHTVSSPVAPRHPPPAPAHATASGTHVPLLHATSAPQASSTAGAAPPPPPRHAEHHGIRLGPGVTTILLSCIAPDPGSYVVDDVHIVMGGGSVVLVDHAPLLLHGYSLPQMLQLARVAEAAADARSASVMRDRTAAEELQRERKAAGAGVINDDINYEVSRWYPTLTRPPVPSELTGSTGVANTPRKYHRQHAPTWLTALEPLRCHPTSQPSEADMRLLLHQPGNSLSAARKTKRSDGADEDAAMEGVATFSMRQFLSSAFSGTHPSTSDETVTGHDSRARSEPRSESNASEWSVNSDEQARASPAGAVSRSDSVPTPTAFTAPVHGERIARALRAGTAQIRLPGSMLRLLLPAPAFPAGHVREGKRIMDPVRGIPSDFVDWLTAVERRKLDYLRLPGPQDEVPHSTYFTDPLALGVYPYAGHRPAAASRASSTTAAGSTISRASSTGHTHEDIVGDAAIKPATGHHQRAITAAGALDLSRLDPSWFESLHVAFVSTLPVAERTAPVHVWMRANHAGTRPTLPAIPHVVRKKTAAPPPTAMLIPRSIAPHTLPLLSGVSGSVGLLLAAAAAPASPREGVQDLKVTMWLPSGARVAGQPYASQLSALHVALHVYDASDHDLLQRAVHDTHEYVTAAGHAIKFSSLSNVAGVTPMQEGERLPLPLHVDVQSDLSPDNSSVSVRIPGGLVPGAFMYVQIPVLVRQQKRAAAVAAALSRAGDAAPPPTARGLHTTQSFNAGSPVFGTAMDLRFEPTVYAPAPVESPHVVCDTASVPCFVGNPSAAAAALDVQLRYADSPILLPPLSHVMRVSVAVEAIARPPAVSQAAHSRTTKGRSGDSGDDAASARAHHGANVPQLLSSRDIAALDTRDRYILRDTAVPIPVYQAFELQTKSGVRGMSPTVPAAAAPSVSAVVPVVSLAAFHADEPIQSLHAASYLSPSASSSPPEEDVMLAARVAAGTVMRGFDGTARATMRAKGAAITASKEAPPPSASLAALRRSSSHTTDETDEEEDDDAYGTLTSSHAALAQQTVTCFIPTPLRLQTYSLTLPGTCGWRVMLDGSRFLIGAQLAPHAASVASLAQWYGVHRVTNAAAQLDAEQELLLPTAMLPYSLAFAFKFSRTISASSSVTARFSMEYDVLLQPRPRAAASTLEAQTRAPPPLPATLEGMVALLAHRAHTASTTSADSPPAASTFVEDVVLST